MSDCPKCGCQAGRDVQRFTRWGRPFVLVDCGHCGERYEQPDDPPIDASQPDSQPEPLAGVPYLPLRTACPACASIRHKSSKKIRQGSVITRRHKCRDCGTPFKSLETISDLGTPGVPHRSSGRRAA